MQFAESSADITFDEDERQASRQRLRMFASGAQSHSTARARTCRYVALVTSIKTGCKIDLTQTNYTKIVPIHEESIAMNDHLPIGHDWLEVVRAPTLSLFASHFHNEATLEGAVVNGTLIGGRAIYAFFSATRQMYDTISFTEETHGKRTVYLEWEGLYRGKPVNGVTSITRKDGLINRVTVNHRPLAQAEAFAHELASHIRHAISRP